MICVCCVGVGEGLYPLQEEENPPINPTSPPPHHQKNDVGTPEEDGSHHTNNWHADFNSEGPSTSGRSRISVETPLGQRGAAHSESGASVNVARDLTAFVMSLADTSGDGKLSVHQLEQALKSSGYKGASSSNTSGLS